MQYEAYPFFVSREEDVAWVIVAVEAAVAMAVADASRCSLCCHWCCRRERAFYKLQAHFLLKEQQFNSAAQYPPEGGEKEAAIQPPFSVL